MNENIIRMVSRIKAGERNGVYVQSLGRQLRSIGFPTVNGIPSLTGTKISFEGMYPEGKWFTINTPEGIKLEIPVKAVNTGPDLNENPPAILPLRDPSPFFGLMLLRPVSNAPEKVDTQIEFWFEALPDQRYYVKDTGKVSFMPGPKKTG